MHPGWASLQQIPWRTLTGHPADAQRVPAGTRPQGWIWSSIQCTTPQSKADNLKQGMSDACNPRKSGDTHVQARKVLLEERNRPW